MTTGTGTDPDATTTVPDGPDPAAAGTGEATTALFGAHGANATADTEPIPLVPLLPAAGRRAPRGTLLIAAALGIGVSVGLGAYSRLHEPTAAALNLAGFSSGLAAKSWLASVALVLAVVQLVSALRMYGRLGRGGARTALVHRWSGRLAVLVTVPVAVHCLYALGFQDFDTRVLVHSAAGCFFYGAFAAKMVLVSRDGAPKWALPVLGGLVFTVLTAIWATSSAWFFATSGVHL